MPALNPNRVESHEVDQDLANDPNTIDQQLEVVVEDDTPPEDRNRKPLAKDPLTETEDEAKNYTKGVQKRIGELTHKAHDERRRAESAQRERDEAVRVAQAAMQRTRMLEQQLVNGEAAYSNESLEKAKLAVESAKAKYRKAFEAGDPDAQADATADLAAASQAELMAKNWAQNAQNKLANAKTSLQAEKDELNSAQQHAGTQEQQTTADKPDVRAQDWASRNGWFGQDRKMTSYLYGVHEDLVFEKGLHPVEDADDYYAAIDKEMRERFPEYQWEDDGDDTGKAKPAASKPASTAKRAAPASPVAPVTRTPTGSGSKVTLTKSQAAMAERLGLSYEQYAREVMKLGA